MIKQQGFLLIKNEILNNRFSFLKKFQILNYNKLQLIINLAYLTYFVFVIQSKIGIELAILEVANLTWSNLVNDTSL